MWINFEAGRPFAVKVFVGGVNAVSGESSRNNMASVLRRNNQLSKGGAIQDYIMPPHHAGLDGVVVQDSQVRQFVATPMGSGYSVEAQLTGDDSIGGLQFEVVSLKVHREPATKGFISLIFRPYFENRIEEVSESTPRLRCAAFCRLL